VAIYDRPEFKKQSGGVAKPVITKKWGKKERKEFEEYWKRKYLEI